MRTTTEASEVLGVRPRTVTRYILRGLIQAEKHGRDYHIPDEELVRFNEVRRKAGRPRQKKVPTQPFPPKASPEDAGGD